LMPMASKIRLQMNRPFLVKVFQGWIFGKIQLVNSTI